MRLTGWILCLGVLLHSVAARAGVVTVFAAASLTDCLTEMGRDYQAATGEQVEFNFAASSTLARQIEDGAPADIFFSADEAKMDALAGKGLIATNTRVKRLSNSLVIVVPVNSDLKIGSASDLNRPEVQRLALADPKAVPAGVYARAWLQKLGFWAGLEPKVVPCLNVRAALAAVESGDAEAGIVFKTDAAISKKVKVAFAAPLSETPPISYPMAMVAACKEPALAKQFLAWLKSKAADGVFEKFGFIVAGARP
jgi:molybdate transport system substrate-binding protein